MESGSRTTGGLTLSEHSRVQIERYGFMSAIARITSGTLSYKNVGTWLGVKLKSEMSGHTAK
jgi:hypothetical protein